RQAVTVRARRCLGWTGSIAVVSAWTIELRRKRNGGAPAQRRGFADAQRRNLGGQLSARSERCRLPSWGAKQTFANAEFRDPKTTPSQPPPPALRAARGGASAHRYNFPQ